eukprot:CAMPEP_0178709360 /NCGR_PEP_ID=MMETSP0699-20121125/17183_1 /TAXON_ID=265572 /ORGANISM="Extubocellulus spinifer, Strain CCMP396" /LENGTH=213 /DNA_ID=CAMNT_0020357791 /DNA_START=2316 /DNA_END=2954 /DNA_ORIENTATION=-
MADDFGIDAGDGDNNKNGGAIQDYRGGDGGDDDNSKAKSCCSKMGWKNKLAVALGLCMLIAGGITAGLQLQKQLTWNQTTGTIIGREYCSGVTSTGRSSNGSDGRTYKPIIQYTAIASNEVERVYEFRSSTCSSPGPTIGNQIPVLYHPDDPQTAMDASFVGAWLVPIVLGGIGLVFAAFPCLPGKTSSGGSGGRGYGNDHARHHHGNYDTEQ